MFKNYLKIAWRNIWKNKAFSLINIIGLSIGLSAAFVIGAMVYYDFTFDKFHLDGERIYRITSDFSTPEGNFHNRGVAVPLNEYAKRNMSGLETVSAFFTMYFATSKTEESTKTFRNIEDAILVDGAYFELFKYEWLAGSPHTLSEPNQMVITEGKAAKYFPNQPKNEIIGKNLVYNDSIPVKITGIVADLEERTDLYFNEFISLETARNTDMARIVFNESWNNSNSDTELFVKLAPNATPKSVQEQLDRVAFDHADKAMYALGQKRNFHLQPLSDVHFNSDYGIFKNSDHIGDKAVLIGLGLVAFFLLVLGSINFINLNTAHATNRAKEIGIRKTLGSSKKQLVIQFLGETLLLVIGAACISVFLASSLFQVFADFMPHGLGIDILTNAPILILFVILLLTITLLSGFYPAMVLSHFKPVSVLKNQVVSGNDKSSIRKYLTVFQFVIAQIFIVATLVVGRQLNFLVTKNMGFETEANAYIRAWQDDDLGKRKNFVNEISKIPEISVISLANNPPASGNSNSTIATYISDGNEIITSLELLFGDLSYLKLYDIPLVAGRDRLNDTIQEYVINETYSKILGFQNPKDAVGQIIKIDDDHIPIVGVMEDFNQRSLRSGIMPMALKGDDNRDFYAQFNTIHFSLLSEASTNLSVVIAKIEEAWRAIYPEDDFEVQFMDDTIKQFYEQERKTSVLLAWATGLAIVISCLGLLGLVIHTTERRTKEIGIRKILGASLAQLNLLLCKEFLILVAIAFAIATPIAWWGTSNWLQDFAYKTDISWWIFLLSGVAMLLIAMVIISIRTVAAANRNPVKSLRTE